MVLAVAFASVSIDASKDGSVGVMVTIPIEQGADSQAQQYIPKWRRASEGAATIINGVPVVRALKGTNVHQSWLFIVNKRGDVAKLCQNMTSPAHCEQSNPTAMVAVIKEATEE